MSCHEARPFFSVIVPIYNVEKYLMECLDSICNQTFKDYELILVDDGSPDLCPKICDQYCQKDARVRVIHKQNGGLVEARKTGITAARGNYTVFVDGDDWIDEGLLLEAYQILQKDLADIIAFDYFRNSGEYQEVCRFQVVPGCYSGENKQEEVCSKMICTGKYYEFGMAPSIATKIFKTELIREKLLQVDGRITMGEDAVVTYPAMLEAETVVISSKAFYHYRDVQESMSQKYDSKYFEKIDVLLDWFDKNNFRELEEQLKLYRLMLLEEGILRIMVQSENLADALKEVKSVCDRKKYRNILMQVEKEVLDPARKSTIMELKEQKYLRLCFRFLPVRIKRKVKQLLRK